MNRLRYCNVIFGDESRNDLATRGDKLSAADLTDGLKTDELLHRKICMEYNNTDKYNDNAWPQLQACKGDPYLFPGPIVWDQSLKTLKTLIREYEYCFNNWKLSGNHGAYIKKVTKERNEGMERRKRNKGTEPKEWNEGTEGKEWNKGTALSIELLGSISGATDELDKFMSVSTSFPWYVLHYHSTAIRLSVSYNNSVRATKRTCPSSPPGIILPISTVP